VIERRSRSFSKTFHKKWLTVLRWLIMEEKKRETGSSNSGDG